MSKQIIECTLSNEKLKSKVTDWVDKLCKSGGNDWSLRVPVDFNHDPDMTILALVNRFSVMEKENRIMKDALEMFSNLKTAYPESVFKPMSKVQYKLLCDNACVSVDRVSAHVLRQCVKGFSDLAINTLQQIKETDR